MNQKLERLEASGKTVGKADREGLLHMFADIKKKLDQMGRDLAFLSIDVVDSTGMKAGEDRPAVEYDFKMYKQLVDGALAGCGCIKATWTPDGVMDCFPTVDMAVDTARGVVLALGDFNRNVKTMKRDFAVRCGVNSGYVYFDETMPLEEISDRVIDVAAHIQKHAAPNTIGVAQPAIEPLHEREGFVVSGKVVDGYQVYEWRE
jgi:class 3 adenylate cyclase